MQLSVYHCPPSVTPASILTFLKTELTSSNTLSVIYRDVHNPRSFGLLLWSEDPAQLVDKQHTLFAHPTTAELRQRTEFNMFGRSYSSGYEQDLSYWLIERPQQTALNPQWPWAIWYPLKRKGEFEQLPAEEQRAILGEHARIGKTYGEQDLAHDIRLACFGLDEHDNDFIIGLIGKELQPLSHVVQSMRKTRQTSEFIERMGPFFVGYVEWRNVANRS
jgi:chlorite dismutase